MSTNDTVLRGLRTIGREITQGFFVITQNGFALIGVAVLFTVLTLAARPEIRSAGEAQLISWLQDRQAALTGMVTAPDAADRATAGDPSHLTRPQSNLTQWLSKKYSIAPEPLSALVSEAYDSGARAKLDPALILAVMAIESGFNPFAQSNVGAQGLMQVMTKVHSDKYQSFGGQMAAFDPVTNMRVGIKVLQDCIVRAGSVEGGLKSYVGAANLDDDGGYTAKVLAEFARLKMVAAGRPVPLATAQQPAPAPAPVSAPATVGSVSRPANLASGERLASL